MLWGSYFACDVAKVFKLTISSGGMRNLAGTLKLLGIDVNNVALVMPSRVMDTQPRDV